MSVSVITSPLLDLHACPLEDSITCPYLRFTNKHTKTKPSPEYRCKNNEWKLESLGKCGGKKKSWLETVCSLSCFVSSDLFPAVSSGSCFNALHFNYCINLRLIDATNLGRRFNYFFRPEAEVKKKKRKKSFVCVSFTNPALGHIPRLGQTLRSSLHPHWQRREGDGRALILMLMAFKDSLIHQSIWSISDWMPVKHSLCYWF